jgi:hypothetical protein
MLQPEETFTFKENMLNRVFISFFFALVSGIVALAAFVQLGKGIVWAVLGAAAIGLGLMLLYFIYSSLRSQRTVTISPQGIRSYSRAEGERSITWREMVSAKEVQTRTEKVRSASPMVEVMLAMYFNMPFMGGGERRGSLVYNGGERGIITVRQHLLYPHRLAQLREATERYMKLRAASSELRVFSLN